MVSDSLKYCLTMIYKIIISTFCLIGINLSVQAEIDSLKLNLIYTYFEVYLNTSINPLSNSPNIKLNLY